MTINTRENWLNIAAAILLEEIVTPALEGRETPPMRYSMTAPKPSQTAVVLGQCWNSKASADETFEIFITAKLGCDDSIEILSTLLHEQMHAFDSLKNGHQGPFISLCKAVGLVGGETKSAKASFTATKAGPELHTLLTDIVNSLGPIPHAALNPSQSGQKQQKNRQKLVTCINSTCSFKFRASQKIIDSMTSNICLSCQQPTLQQQ